MILQLLRRKKVGHVIVVSPRPEHGDYRADTEALPGEWGTGKTVYAAIGDLVRVCYQELDLEDRDLQVQLGVHWDEMSNYELGCLVTRDREVGITLEVKGHLPKQSEV
jgi:hypothetical protein